MKDSDTDELRGRVYFDDESDANQPILYCLRWEKHFNPRVEMDCFACIILCEIDGFIPRRFRRVGVGSTETSDWLIGEEEKIVII